MARGSIVQVCGVVCGACGLGYGVKSPQMARGSIVRNDSKE